jgi:hypothetical protein
MFLTTTNLAASYGKTAAHRAGGFQNAKEVTTTSLHLQATKKEKDPQKQEEGDSLTTWCSSSSNNDTFSHEFSADYEDKVRTLAGTAAHPVDCKQDILIPIHDSPSRIPAMSVEQSKRELLLDNIGQFQDLLNQCYYSEDEERDDDDDAAEDATFVLYAGDEEDDDAARHQHNFAWYR